MRNAKQFCGGYAGIGAIKGRDALVPQLNRQFEYAANPTKPTYWRALRKAWLSLIVEIGISNRVTTRSLYDTKFAVRFTAALIACAVGVMASDVAIAQLANRDMAPDIPPPVTVREFGVDVSSGAIEYQHTDLSVGSGEFPSRLDLVRTYDMQGYPSLNAGSGNTVWLPSGDFITTEKKYSAFGDGGSFNLQAYFTTDRFSYGETVLSRDNALISSGVANINTVVSLTVNALGKSYHFGTRDIDPTIRQWDYDGDSFVIIHPPGVNYAEYLLTTHDGIRIYFSDSGAYNYDLVGGRYAKYIEFPDGQFISYAYENSPYVTGAVRLKTITNSKGYGYTFSYINNSNNAHWSTDNSFISSITSFHNPCVSGTSVNCATGSLQTASYNYAGSPSNTSEGAYPLLLTETNSLSQIWSYSYDSRSRLTGISSPIATISGTPSARFGFQDWVYDVGEAVVQNSTPVSYTDGLGNSTYFLFGEPDHYPIGVTVQYPDNTTKMYLSKYCLPTQTIFTDLSGCKSIPAYQKYPTLFVDGLGLSHIYSYDFIGRMATHTNPDGDVLTYTRDGNGNVTQVVHQSKPGSGLPNLTSSWGYTTCTTANYKWCNKPIYVIDPRRNRTDYQYDSNSGNVAVELKPANAQNIRAVTRYYYTPFSYANLANIGGVFPVSVTTPPSVYLLTEKDECLTSAVTGTNVDFTYVCSSGSRRRTLYNYVPSTASAPTSYELVSEIDDADDVAASTTYTYDSVGNVISVTDPMRNASYSTYDVLRRKVFEIGASPGSGNPRQVIHHVYDADGNETRTEYGTGTKTDGSDFTLLRHKQMTYDANDRLVLTQEIVP